MPDYERYKKPEFSSKGDRNRQIKGFIEQGLIPMLPFEHAVLWEQLRQASIDRDVLSQLMAEALDQSSETWHDNAPVEVLNDSSTNLYDRARNVGKALKHSLLIESPGHDYPRVTIGSVVYVSFNGGDPEPIFISGSLRELPNHLHPDITVATLASPLGQAIFGKTDGKTAKYEVNGRQITVTIHAIDQDSGEALAS
jgi:transcription elongation GreA/GreB family factor